MRYNLFSVFSEIGERAKKGDFQGVDTMRIEIRYNDNTSQSFLFNPPNIDWHTVDLFDELLPYLNRSNFFEVSYYTLTSEEVV